MKMSEENLKALREEASYQERLKNWECRDWNKTWEHEKEAEREEKREKKLNVWKVILLETTLSITEEVSSEKGGR